MIHLVRPTAAQPVFTAPHSWLVPSLEVLTVAACLALGAACVGSLLAQPPALDATVRVCPAGPSSPC